MYEQYGNRIKRVTLISSSGGAFEVTVDEVLVYSKRATKRHTTFDEIRSLIDSEGNPAGQAP